MIKIKNEDMEQITVIAWSVLHMTKYPELKWLYHCPNRGKRNKNEAAKLKQMGVKAGVSDLHLPVPKGRYHGLFIEMKQGKNTLTANQKKFLSDMAAAGYFVCTCYSADLAITIIEDYIKLENKATMTIDNNIACRRQVECGK